MIRNALHKHARAVIVAGLATVVVAGGLAWAGIPGDNGVIHACYSNSKGALRVIDAATDSCNDRETPILWNQTGPPGTDGTNGAPGTNGTNGFDGTNGTDGKTVLNGTETPDERAGTLGDFYLDTTASTLYGPKTEAGWGAGTSLVGPAGADGTDGTDGTNGADGTNGPPGPGAIKLNAGLLKGDTQNLAVDPFTLTLNCFGNLGNSEFSLGASGTGGAQLAGMKSIDDTASSTIGYTTGNVLSAGGSQLTTIGNGDADTRSHFFRLGGTLVLHNASVVTTVAFDMFLDDRGHAGTCFFRGTAVTASEL